MGRGWTCYTAPDTFKKAGAIVEVTADGRYLHFMTFSGQPQEGQSAIGAVRYTHNFGIRGLSGILARFGLLQADDDISAKLDRTFTLSVSYGDTRKFVIDANDLTEINSQIATKTLTPSSRYLIFRESHAAKTISVYIDTADIQKLGLNFRTPDENRAGLTVTRNSKGEYKLQEEFQEYLGICTIATALVVEQHFHGHPKLSLGDDITLPSDIVVQER